MEIYYISEINISGETETTLFDGVYKKEQEDDSVFINSSNNTYYIEFSLDQDFPTFGAYRLRSFLIPEEVYYFSQFLKENSIKELNWTPLSTFPLITSKNILSIKSSFKLPLSNYDYGWGWGLVVPKSLSGSEVSKYYDFFEYNPKEESSYYNNIIDWNNPMTTLNFQNSSFDLWSKESGIVQNIISYELTKGLKLFTSAANIQYNN